MKKYFVTSLAVIVIGLMAAAQAQVPGPGWSTSDPGAVHAEWFDWTAFDPGLPYVPDMWSATDTTGESVDPVSFGTLGGPDALGLEATYPEPYPVGTDGIAIEANYDFSTWMPTYAGQQVMEGYVEITYWDDENDPDWRQGWDLAVSHSGDGGLVHRPVLIGEEHDLNLGLITEAYTFAIEGSPSGFFVDFAADPELSPGNPAFVYAIGIDALSYNIPEPNVFCSLILGIALAAGRRSRKV